MHLSDTVPHAERLGLQMGSKTPPAFCLHDGYLSVAKISSEWEVC